MNDLRFSIVTPSFNRSDMIGDTIRSVMNQTYRNFEYRVIDGGSTDGTVEILRRRAAEADFDFVSESDNGMYDAINKGFRKSTGDIFGYLNSDDLYFPWTLDRVVQFFRARPHIDMVLGDSLVHDVKTGEHKLNIYPVCSQNWLFCGAIIAQPTVFFRRTVFSRVGPFARNVRYLGDCEYWLRVLDAGFKAGKIHEFLAVENNHGATLRNRFRDRIEYEKEFLVQKHARPPYRSKSMRHVLLRLKYVEKEMLTLWFALKVCLSIRTGRWNRFLSAYHLRFHFHNYIGNKLRLNSRTAWSLEPVETERYPC